MTEIVAGIEYKKPKVYLMNESGLGVAEFAGRTAYNSFDKSENMSIQQVNSIVNGGIEIGDDLSHFIEEINNIDSSEILSKLAHVYHHDSVLEHINLQYLVKGTSRGVLQEHARHRIQSITVQSTRYTMSSVINAFIASNSNYTVFEVLIKNLDMFVVSNEAEELEIKQLFEKLQLQNDTIGEEEFLNISLSKENIDHINSLKNESLDNINSLNVFNVLQSNKQKRNVGDNFKHIVTDNWKVDLVFTMNLRALSNYLKLRDSGAAYFQIQWLAKEIINVTPQKYLDLVSKKYKEKQ